MGQTDKYETATFAGGCFWGIEDAFRKVKGVKDAVSGYAGGHTEHPTYEQVCTGTTGHAESVEVTFDPKEVSYKELLEVFWDIHNPTTLNRQGPDVGHQYRSVVFCHSPTQKAAAEQSKAELQKSGKYERDIVTEIVPAEKFWRAEEYHQRYFEKHGGDVCHM